MAQSCKTHFRKQFEYGIDEIKRRDLELTYFTHWSRENEFRMGLKTFDVAYERRAS